MKAVIFDMDGVLVDSEPIHFEVDKRVMSKCGVDISDDVLNDYVGISNPEMWIDLKRKYSLKESVDELLRCQSGMKIQVLNSIEIEPIPGIRELLDDLFGNRVVMGIASSSPRFFIEAVIDKFGIRHYFKTVMSGEEVKRGKPEPDLFLRTAELMQVAPEECVVIEDSGHGVKAALSAGMHCIGFINPNSGRQDLSNASFIVNNIYKLNYTVIQSLGK